MNILVSYQPEESAGEPIVVDLVFSESYDVSFHLPLAPFQL